MPPMRPLHTSRFVELLAPGHSGPPALFVSHRRGAPFAELAGAVADHAALAVRGS
jgi:hypothetical protein